LGRRGRRKVTRPKRQENNNSIGSFFRVWKIIAAVGLLSSLYITHLTLKPRISIEPDMKMVSIDPFSSLFRIKNDGYVAIKNVVIAYGVSNLDIKYSRRLTNVNVILRGETIKELKPNQIETAFRGVRAISVDQPPTSANIDITISYDTYWPPPWRETKKYVFTLVTAPDGSQHWQHTDAIRDQ